MSKIDTHIWIGSVYNAHDKKFLNKHGITHILSCAKEFRKADFQSKIQYHILPITDNKVNSRTELLFREGAAVIDKWVRAGHTMIVHCHAGISRSVSVVMAYYILYRGYTYDMAYSTIQHKRPTLNVHPLYVPILHSLEKARKTRKANASRIIILNPSKTKYLVGKESYFIKNKPGISDHTKKEMEILFMRKIKDSVSKDTSNPAEIKYYSKQLDAIKDIVSGRITFGDIRYIEIDSQWYSYTIPQYVPEDTPFSFPGGQPKRTNSNTTCAVREFYEESGIDLTKEPYSLTKLLDTGSTNGNYIILHYVADEKEYAHMLSDIEKKNKSPNAELHCLQFVDIHSGEVSPTARHNYRKLPRTYRIHRIHRHVPSNI